MPWRKATIALNCNGNKYFTHIKQCIVIEVYLAC